MSEIKEKSKISRSKSYFYYMMFILILVTVVDTYVTNFPNVIRSVIIHEFLFEYPENMATSIISFSVAIATLGMYFSFLNQYLADRVGRKILLVVVVFGFGLSSLLLAFSTNIIEYTIYLFMLYVFFSSDIWLIYINEECPADKRAFYTNIILVFSIAGALVIPLFRSMFITETLSNWRGMTYFAIILAFPLSLVILFSIKETSMYEEIKEGKIIQENMFKLLKENLKKVRNKSFYVILILSFILGLNHVFTTLGEIFISNSPNLNVNDVNIIVLVMSFSSVVGYFITGVLGDKYGRKPLIYVYTIMIPISILILVFGINSHENALFFVALGAALTNFAYWGLTITSRIVTLELIPTEARGTGVGVKSLITAFGMTMGLILSGIITQLVV